METITKGISLRKFLLQMLLLAVAASAHAETATRPPIDAFARIPAIRNVAISPDGKQLMLITGVDDAEAVATVPADFSATPKLVFASRSGDYDLSWCSWANNK